jgi:hypothetical protein
VAPLAADRPGSACHRPENGGAWRNKKMKKLKFFRTAGP